MVLKAYKERTFKANVRFIEDNSVVGATFRVPRQLDYYISEDGNKFLERQKLIANIFKSFDKPVQVELEDGSIVNVDNLSYLQDIGVAIDTTDCINKLSQELEAVSKEKDELVKKQKSAGNSTKKAMTKGEN